MVLKLDIAEQGWMSHLSTTMLEVYSCHLRKLVVICSGDLDVESKYLFIAFWLGRAPGCITNCKGITMTDNLWQEEGKRGNEDKKGIARHEPKYIFQLSTEEERVHVGQIDIDREIDLWVNSDKYTRKMHEWIVVSRKLEGANYDLLCEK